MKNKARSFALILAALFCRDAFSGTEPKPRLYLAMGQSNMVGLGAFAEPPLEANPRIQYRIRNLWRSDLKDPEWAAIPPLNEKDGKLRGLGPWWAFSKEMAATHPDAEIRVLMLAVSGSSLNKWIKGGDFYEGNLVLIRKALDEGMELKGIIWHQGEAGTGMAEGPAYDELFAQMVADYRADLGIEGPLPIVAGTIGTKGPTGKVNGALLRLEKTLPDFAVAHTENRVLSDNVHYDAATAAALGREMAIQMLRLQQATLKKEE